MTHEQELLKQVAIILSDETISQFKLQNIECYGRTQLWYKIMKYFGMPNLESLVEKVIDGQVLSGEIRTETLNFFNEHRNVRMQDVLGEVPRLC
jgi:hypothetical protein